jgi:glycosyltransferase involved in cell wall biosynthesis
VNEGTRVPKISVISIARKAEELEKLCNALKNQTFQDFELITSTKGTIPHAWNDAVSQASGEFLVFIESDAIPLNNRWLEEIAKFAKKNTLLKGLEINSTDLDMCNLVCDASIFKQTKFDESFHSAEDMELFARLRKTGVKIEHMNTFPVIHCPEQTWKKTLSRSFRNGMLFAKIVYLHGRSNVDNVNTKNFVGKHINPISNRVRMITENVLILLGLFVGGIRYLPIAINNKIQQKMPKKSTTNKD